MGTCRKTTQRPLKAGPALATCYGTLLLTSDSQGASIGTTLMLLNCAPLMSLVLTTV